MRGVRLISVCSTLLLVGSTAYAGEPAQALRPGRAVFHDLRPFVEESLAQTPQQHPKTGVKSRWSRSGILVAIGAGAGFGLGLIAARNSDDGLLIPISYSVYGAGAGGLVAGLIAVTR
jgi:hypothetical protein